MRALYLSGHGISMRVENAHLMVKDGHEYERPEPSTYELKPKYDDYDNIVVYGHSGNVTLEAIKWLSKQNIQLTVLNWDGSLLTNILIPEPKAGGIRLAQYQAYSGKMRVDVARRLIDAKIHNSIHVLEWLCQRYPELKEDERDHFVELASFRSRLPKATTVAQIRGVDGMVAMTMIAVLRTKVSIAREGMSLIIGVRRASQANAAPTPRETMTAIHRLLRRATNTSPFSSKMIRSRLTLP